MDMSDSVRVLPEHRQRVFPGKCEMSGVIAQEDQLRIRILHHAVRLLARLHDGSHMVMETQPEPTILRDLSKVVQSPGEPVPFLIIHHVLMTAGQDRDIHLPLDRIALLADIDPVCADCRQKIQVCDEVLLLFLDRAGQKKGGIPAACNSHSAKIQRLLQLHRIGRILVADLTPCEACQRHLADGLLECVLRTQFRHIIVAPPDRGNSKKYLAFVKHFSSSCRVCGCLCAF